MVEKKTRQWKKYLIASAVISAAFAYGVIVGRYKVFPFAQLKAAKSIVISPPVKEVSEPVVDGRRINYLNRVAIYGITDVNADVVMIGDSITDYAEWSEMFPGASIANRGIAGDTTARVLERIDSVIATGARTALIMVGVNDINEGMTAEEVFANYEQIMDKLVANGMHTYIQSTLLLGESLKSRNGEIVALNEYLRELAVRRNQSFVDLNTRLAANGYLEDRFTSDSIHLNPAGYLVWKELIGPIVTGQAISLQPRASSDLTEPKHQ